MKNIHYAIIALIICVTRVWAFTATGTNIAAIAAARLEKHCPENIDEAMVCLESKQDDVNVCIDAFRNGADKSILLSIAKYLGEIRSKIIPNYHELPKSENSVRVEISGKLVYNPQESTDPEVKKAYDSALAQWQLHNATVRLQGFLKALDVEVMRNLSRVCSSISSKNSSDIEFLKQVADAGHFTESERAAILK